MNTLRIAASLLEQVRQNLSLPHPVAYERMGFVHCRAARLRDGILVLAETYEPVADENYVADTEVGGRMNGAAIRIAMQRSLTTGTGIFHVHMHDWTGIPVPSATDRREARKFVPDFFNVQPKMPHGFLIVSQDALAGWLWGGKSTEPAAFDRVEIGGRPIRILDVRV